MMFRSLMLKNRLCIGDRDGLNVCAFAVKPFYAHESRMGI